jgi:hypothetical protein
MADEPGKPRSRLWRWVRRAAAVLLVLALLVTVFQAAWSLRAQAGLDAKIAALRAAGEPMLLQDLTARTLPDEQNAALDYLEAAKLVRTGTAAWDNRTGKWSAPVHPYRTALGRALLATIASENAPAVDRARRARAKPDAAWPVVWTSPAASLLLPELAPQRTLFVAVESTALAAHAAGDDVRAMELCEGSLHHARMLGRHPTLIGTLVALGITGGTAQAIELIAADLSPEGRDPARRVIVALLDEAPARAAMHAALHAERAMLYDNARYAIGNGFDVFTGAPDPWASLGTKALRPVLWRDLNAGIAYMGDVIAASGAATTAPGYRSREPAHPTATRNPYINLVSAVPHLERVHETHFRVSTGRRMAAIALAVRLYALDHDGRLPATLDELVPVYLPHVPRDAMDITEAPLRYMPNADPPVIYSVGPNGVDDGGKGEQTTAWGDKSPDVVVSLVPVTVEVTEARQEE